MVLTPGLSSTWQTVEVRLSDKKPSLVSIGEGWHTINTILRRDHQGQWDVYRVVIEGTLAALRYNRLARVWDIKAVPPTSSTPLLRYPSL